MVNKFQHCVTDDGSGDAKGDYHDEESDEDYNTCVRTDSFLVSVITLNLSFMPLLSKRRKYIMQSSVQSKKPSQFMYYSGSTQKKIFS